MSINSAGLDQRISESQQCHGNLFTMTIPSWASMVFVAFTALEKAPLVTIFAIFPSLIAMSNSPVSSFVTTSPFKTSKSYSAMVHELVLWDNQGPRDLLCMMRNCVFRKLVHLPTLEASRQWGLSTPISNLAKMKVHPWLARLILDH